MNTKQPNEREAAKIKMLGTLKIAEEHLRAAVLAFYAASAEQAKLNRCDDCRAMAERVSELLESDHGEAGLTPWIRKLAADRG